MPYIADNEAAPRIGIPITSPSTTLVAKDNEAFDANEEADSELDSQVESFIEAIGGTEADQDELTPSGFAEMVRIAMKADGSIAINDSGTEALESFFGEVFSGSDAPEANAPAESDESSEEAYDKISGLAQRVMLAEAALQIIVTLPAEAFESESEAGIGRAVGLARAAARIAKLVKKYGPKIWIWLKRGGKLADLGMTAYDIGQLILAQEGEAAYGSTDQDVSGEIDGEAAQTDAEDVEDGVGEADAEADELEAETQNEESFGEAFLDFLGAETSSADDPGEAVLPDGQSSESKRSRSVKANGKMNGYHGQGQAPRHKLLVTVSEQD